MHKYIVSILQNSFVDEVSRNLNEPTCKNDIHEFDVLINNDLGYCNITDVNNLLDYPDENDTCTKVQSLKEIVNIIEENS